LREYGIGQSLPRSEDIRLVQGRGGYTDDFGFANQAHLYVVRSPHPAARIVSIDTRAARALPGVLAVLTGDDVIADGLGTFPCRVKRHTRDGKPNFVPPHRALAAGRVRHVGDAVVAVVAETLAIAKDAGELVAVEYEELPAVTGTADAIRRGAPAVWDEAPDNVCFFFEIGKKKEVEDAFARAAHVARHDFVINRVSANPMEPRNAIGLYDQGTQRYTLYTGTQAPHAIRTEMAELVLKIPENRLRIVSPDVGGAFGMKDGIFPEQILVMWASKRTGRPVRWQCERGEAFLADHHARDNVSTAELALDKDGKFLALRVTTTANLGAYLNAHGPHSSTNNLGGLAGTYTTPAIYSAVTAVFSNTSPTSPYRGAGRPEASYAIECVIDVAARQMGIDRVELRRRNMIPASAMPYDTGFVFTYDSGEFEKNLDDVLKLSDWSGFDARWAASSKRGKLRGIGIASVIEIAAGPPAKPLEEFAEIRFDPSGDVTMLAGTHSHGQGHEITYTQILVELLGIDPSRIRFVFGDTDQVAYGKGTFGSRSASVIATASKLVAEKLIEKGKLIAAHLLEAAPGDIEFADGNFTIAGTDRALPIHEIAKASYRAAALPPGIEPGFNASVIHQPAGPTFPNGCHVAEVEIDEETGVVEVVRYSVVDDLGRVVNPMLAKGQVHGGVAQGLGQILMESIEYEPDSGQLLTGSFSDYAMPRAHHVPFMTIETNEVPAKTNPFGIKGAGEAGCVGALPAIMNAINDALYTVGARCDMPATPQRVWRAIEEAKSKKV
jgi:carbon-monoxide dehydrogenase large subunit